ncbi:hypothetical protein DENIT_20318 [Pseudomonas veronii]|nr:hypothetical protein DENIT_20318 [Pseudomonas veronii]
MTTFFIDFKPKNDYPRKLKLKKPTKNVEKTQCTFLVRQQKQAKNGVF